MPLAPGARLGPYEVVAFIGAGGMGEVYKARDTRLDRHVALKVSRADFGERFEREARAVAALNHPHICTLHDVGPNYLVMEYIDGSPLMGPLPLDQALKYGAQIADALDAAHTKHIIHRDLKPANILVTKAGVKLLDFGLARIEAASAGDGPKAGTIGGLTTLSTESALTVQGTTMGTVPYMAPEQLQGRPADARSDIFAFGLVLYEMLTGKRAFHGSTAASIIGAILERPVPVIEPEPMHRGVNRLIATCVAKDPEDRFQTARDLKRAIEWSAPGVETLTATRGASRSWIVWPAAAAICAALAVIGWLRPRQMDNPDQTRDRLVVSTLLPPAGGQFDFEFPWALPALSPDGTQVVFGAKTEGGTTQLWLRRLDSLEAQPIPGTEGAASPFWSPDGRWIAFGQGTTLKKVEARGGAPRLITESPAVIRGGSWSADDVILVGVNRSPGAIVRVAASGGPLAPATSFEKGRETGWHLFPVFLPDGKRFLYAQSDADGWRILAGDLRHPEQPGTIVTQTESMALPAQGRIVYLQGAALWARDFDPATLKVVGEPQPLAQGLGASVTGDATFTSFTVSPNGLIAYETPGSGGRSRLIWVDRQGNRTGSLGDAVNGTIGSIAIAPDEKRVAIDIEDRPGRGDIWIYEIGRPVPARLTFDEAWDRDPVWSPDSRTIYFRSNRSGRFDLYRTSADRTSPEELLSEDDIDKMPTGVSPDGKSLFYSTRGNESRNDIWALPLQPRGAPFPLLQNPYPENGGVPSPDGKWLAYIANDQGHVDIYATPLPGHASRQQISLGGGGMPIRWRRKGKVLFYLNFSGQLMSVETDLSDGTLKSGSPVKLFDRANARVFDASADGQRFLVVDSGSGRTLTLLQNWNPTPSR
jgi:Tol biopolymer transport system component